MSDPVREIELLADEIDRIDGAEVTHVVMNPVIWAGLRLHRPPLQWKSRSIRAARRDRGRMLAAMRKAETECRRRA